MYVKSPISRVRAVRSFDLWVRQLRETDGHLHRMCVVSASEQVK